MLNRTVLVTGAASGIGHATCIAFAEHGAKVIAADEDIEGAERTVLMASEHSGNSAGHMAVQVNVADVHSVMDLATAVKDKYGGLDFAVNCAGVEADRAPLHQSSLDCFDTVMDVNVRGTYLCMREELNLMLQGVAARGVSPDAFALDSRGIKIDTDALHAMATDFMPAIVNVASTAGCGPCPDFGAYGASKAAVISLTQTAAVEVAGKVRINCLAPATTYTPMYQRYAERWPDWQQATNAGYAAARICTAEEVARAALWLCSRECNFMVGSLLRIDGGQGFGPMSQHQQRGISSSGSRKANQGAGTTALLALPSLHVPIRGAASAKAWRHSPGMSGTHVSPARCSHGWGLRAVAGAGYKGTRVAPA